MSIVFIYSIFFAIMVKLEYDLVKNYNTYWICVILQIIIFIAWKIILKIYKNKYSYNNGMAENKSEKIDLLVTDSNKSQEKSAQSNYSWDNYYSKPSYNDNSSYSHWIIDTDNKPKTNSSNQSLEKDIKKERKHVDEINRQLDEIEKQIADFRKTINVNSENVDVTTDNDDITDDIFENIEFDNISGNPLDNLSDDKTTNDSISQNILRLINENIDDIDPMFEDIVEVIIENRFASTSLFQRKLQISYARADRIIDFLEKVNIISSSNSKFREVLISKEQWTNNIKPYLPKTEINHKSTAINKDSTFFSSYAQQTISSSSNKPEDNSFDEWFNEIINKAPYSYIVINGKTELSQKGKIYNDPVLKKAVKAVYEGKDISSTYIQYYFKTSEKKANQIINTLKDLKILKK